MKALASFHLTVITIMVIATVVFFAATAAKPVSADEGCQGGSALRPEQQCSGNNGNIIGDVWNDTNGDRFHETYERGILNATVILYDQGGNELGRRDTDLNGRFNFIGLAPGYYAVKAFPPAPYTQFTTFDTVAIRPDSFLECCTAQAHFGVRQGPPPATGTAVPTETPRPEATATWTGTTAPSSTPARTTAPSSTPARTPVTPSETPVATRTVQPPPAATASPTPRPTNTPVPPTASPSGTPTAPSTPTPPTGRVEIWCATCAPVDLWLRVDNEPAGPQWRQRTALRPEGGFGALWQLWPGGYNAGSQACVYNTSDWPAEAIVCVTISGAGTYQVPIPASLDAALCPLAPPTRIPPPVATVTSGAKPGERPPSRFREVTVVLDLIAALLILRGVVRFLRWLGQRWNR